MCLLAALDSQGIVVKCTAAIFFRTVDSSVGWDRTSACKGSCYQSIFWSHPPIQPTQECARQMKSETEIGDHTGHYVPYSFQTVCGFGLTSHRLLGRSVVRRDLRFIVLIREDKQNKVQDKNKFELTTAPISILAFSTDCFPSLIRILRENWLLPANKQTNKQRKDIRCSTIYKMKISQDKYYQMYQN